MRTWMIFAFLLPQLLFAQPENDFWPHRERMPILAKCAALPKPEAKKCSDATILRLLALYFKPPTNCSEGTAIVSFFIDEQGRPEPPRLMRDVPGGGGEAALEAVEAMQRDGRLRFRPGAIWLKEGWKPVRIQMNFPFKMKVGRREQLLAAAEKHYPLDKEVVRIATPIGRQHPILPQLIDASEMFTDEQEWVLRFTSSFRATFTSVVGNNPLAAPWYGTVKVPLSIDEEGRITNITFLDKIPSDLSAALRETLSRILQTGDPPVEAAPAAVLLEIPVFAP